MPGLSWNQTDAEKGSVSGKPQSRQSRATVSKQEPSEAECPELSESTFTRACCWMTKENAMNLQEQGCRYYVSPDKWYARWMAPAVQAAFSPTWIDVTDWADEKLDAWIKQSTPAQLG